MEPDIKRETHSLAVPLFLSGAVIGAVAGVLLAPDSGKETRRKLTAWIKEKRMIGKEQIVERKEAVLAAIEAGRKAYKDTEKKLAGV